MIPVLCRGKNTIKVVVDHGLIFIVTDQNAMVILFFRVPGYPTHYRFLYILGYSLGT
jgi:serine protease inhibitor